MTHTSGAVPASQYSTDRNLLARQRLWEQQVPRFDLVGWVLDLAGLEPGPSLAHDVLDVLDVGCGNGQYLEAVGRCGHRPTGLDLSIGMLRSSIGMLHRTDPAVIAPVALINGDAQRLPFADDSFDVVLAPHMLYHVPDVAAAAAEMRRVLRRAGVCVAVTNGVRHIASLREVITEAVVNTDPGWTMPTPATHGFNLETGGDALRTAFDQVEVVRPANLAPVRVDDAAIVADYVASVGDIYAHQVRRPWPDVVADVRSAVGDRIRESGAFEVASDPGAFLCRG